MAIRKLLPIMLTATMTVTACASPYADALKTALANCQAGNQGSCTYAGQLTQEDTVWHAQQNERAGHIALAILGGLAVGAAAYGAARTPPPPPPPPVFILPPRF